MPSSIADNNCATAIKNILTPEQRYASHEYFADFESAKEYFMSRYGTEFQESSDLQFGQAGLFRKNLNNSANSVIYINIKTTSDIEKDIAIAHEGHHAKNFFSKLHRGSDGWGTGKIGKGVSLLYSKGYFLEEISAHYIGGLRGEHLMRRFLDHNNNSFARKAQQQAYFSFAQGKALLKSSLEVLDTISLMLSRDYIKAFEYDRRSGKVVFNIITKKEKPSTFSLEIKKGLSLTEAILEINIKLEEMRLKIVRFSDMYDVKVDKLAF